MKHATMNRHDDPRCSWCRKDHVTPGSPDWGVPVLCTIEQFRRDHPGVLERVDFEMSAAGRRLATARRRRERRAARRPQPKAAA